MALRSRLAVASGGVLVVLAGAVAFSGSAHSASVTPVAVDDSYSTDAGVGIDVDATTGLGANDLDAGGLLFQLQSGPTAGDLSLDTDGSFSFDPLALTSGDAATFTYCLFSDAQSRCLSNTATVTITIGPTSTTTAPPPPTTTTTTTAPPPPTTTTTTTAPPPPTTTTTTTTAPPPPTTTTTTFVPPSAASSGASSATATDSAGSSGSATATDASSAGAAAGGTSSASSAVGSSTAGSSTGGSGTASTGVDSAGLLRSAAALLGAGLLLVALGLWRPRYRRSH